MKKKLFISGITLFNWLGSVLALPLVNSLPPSSCYITHNETSPCNYTYYTIDTANYRDFNYSEKVAEQNDFISIFGSHVDVPSPSLTPSYSYNCHGNVFIGAGGWLNDPSPFEGVTYQENASGTVYRWSGHSAFEGYGTTYIYAAKCGRTCWCYHDNEQPYGAHSEIWCKIGD